MIKVTCQLEDFSDPAKPEVKVHNHWCYRDLVEIEVEGKRYTVCGQDMIEAVKNAMNTSR